MTMENPPIEDVSPIKNGGFSIAMLVFRGYNPYFAQVEWKSWDRASNQQFPTVGTPRLAPFVQSCGAGCA